MIDVTKHIGSVQTWWISNILDLNLVKTGLLCNLFQFDDKFLRIFVFEIARHFGDTILACTYEHIPTFGRRQLSLYWESDDYLVSVNGQDVGVPGDEVLVADTICGIESFNTEGIHQRNFSDIHCSSSTNIYDVILHISINSTIDVICSDDKVVRHWEPCIAHNVSWVLETADSDFIHLALGHHGLNVSHDVKATGRNSLENCIICVTGFISHIKEGYSSGLRAHFERIWDLDLNVTALEDFMDRGETKDVCLVVGVSGQISSFRVDSHGGWRNNTFDRCKSGSDLLAVDFGILSISCVLHHG